MTILLLIFKVCFSLLSNVALRIFIGFVFFECHKKQVSVEIKENIYSCHAPSFCPRAFYPPFDWRQKHENVNLIEVQKRIQHNYQQMKNTNEIKIKQTLILILTLDD